MSDIIFCSNCGMPQHAVTGFAEGRCLDEVACNARRKIALGTYQYNPTDPQPVKLSPGLWLVGPEGVMKLEPNRLGD